MARQDAGRHGPPARRIYLAPERPARRLHGRRRLPRRAEVRPRGSVDGDDRRQGDAPDERRRRARRHRFLAGRQVPLIRPVVRHRHDHQAETESWRTARSVYPARGRRRSGQPDALVGPRAQPDPMVARQPVHLLHRGDGRRGASVPGGGGGRREGGAGDEGAATARQSDDRQGLHDHRLHRRPARCAGRSLCRGHRRHERAPLDRLNHDLSRSWRSAKASACSGTARTAPRSRDGCWRRRITNPRRARIR